MPPRIDEYSRAGVPVRQLFNDTPLGTASAFVWKEHGRHFLITNWHAVTMVDPNTGPNLHSQAGRPNKLIAYFNPRFYEWEKHAREIPLLDDRGKPRWIIHGVHGRSIDVVVIPLPELERDDRVDYCPINWMTREEEHAIIVGMDVFVLGYPFGANPPYFPVWKRGSIASEPELAGIGHKYFLIDSASRPGMSGAPVILRSVGMFLKENDAVSTTARPATRFIGVYSGRLHTNDPLDAQIGMVWPRRLITEIIMDGHLDAAP
jgi:hypothetical protein